MVPNDVHHIFLKMMFMECSDSSFSKALPPLEGHLYLLLLTDAKVGRRTGHDHSSPWKLQYWALNQQPQNIRLLVISEIYIYWYYLCHIYNPSYTDGILMFVGYIPHCWIVKWMQS